MTAQTDALIDATTKIVTVGLAAKVATNTLDIGKKKKKKGKKLSYFK